MSKFKEGDLVRDRGCIGRVVRASGTRVEVRYLCDEMQSVASEILAPLSYLRVACEGCWKLYTSSLEYLNYLIECDQ